MNGTSGNPAESGQGHYRASLSAFVGLENHLQSFDMVREKCVSEPYSFKTPMSTFFQNLGDRTWGAGGLANTRASRAHQEACAGWLTSSWTTPSATLRGHPAHGAHEWAPPESPTDRSEEDHSIAIFIVRVPIRRWACAAKSCLAQVLLRRVSPQS